MRNQILKLLLMTLMLRLSLPLVAQLPDFKDTRTPIDIDGDGVPDLNLLRSEALFAYPPSLPNSSSPVYWIDRWYLEALGTTKLVQFDATVVPGTVVRGTDGEGQVATSPLLLYDGEWLQKNLSFGPGAGNFATGPVIDAQVRGLNSYYVGVRMGTNNPPRTGWVRIPTGYFPYTTNWPKEFLGTYSPPFWTVSVAETKVAPGTNTSIRIGSPADTGLRWRRRATNLVVEIPDAASAARLETATSPFGPWSPAKSEWDLTLTLPLNQSGEVPTARYYRIHPQ